MQSGQGRNERCYGAIDLRVKITTKRVGETDWGIPGVYGHITEPWGDGMRDLTLDSAEQIHERLLLCTSLTYRSIAACTCLHVVSQNASLNASKKANF